MKTPHMWLRKCRGYPEEVDGPPNLVQMWKLMMTHMHWESERKQLITHIPGFLWKAGSSQAGAKMTWVCYKRAAAWSFYGAEGVAMWQRLEFLWCRGGGDVAETPRTVWASGGLPPHISLISLPRCRALDEGGTTRHRHCRRSDIQPRATSHSASPQASLHERLLQYYVRKCVRTAFCKINCFDLWSEKFECSKARNPEVIEQFKL